jgi:hypothetical protein
MEQKYKDIEKQTESIKFQLEEKHIKEQLISEIIKEEALRREKEKEE